MIDQDKSKFPDNRLFNQRVSRLSVQVVDDNEKSRNMVAAVLREMRFKHITLNPDGIEAMAALESEGRPFDLIICDWMMPKMDGLEYLKAIRKLGHKSYFIMLTAKAVLEDVSEAQKAGINAYVPKPFTLDGLEEKLASAVKTIMAPRKSGQQRVW